MLKPNANINSKQFVKHNFKINWSEYLESSNDLRLKQQERSMNDLKWILLYGCLLDQQNVFSDMYLE